MNTPILNRILGGLILSSSMAIPAFAGNEVIQIRRGYVYKLHCEGRLLVSAIGSEQLLRLEALPKELGCGVLLKAVSIPGTTNLLLETSTGTITRIIEVVSDSAHVRLKDLELLLTKNTDMSEAPSK